MRSAVTRLSVGALLVLTLGVALAVAGGRAPAPELAPPAADADLLVYEAR